MVNPFKISHKTTNGQVVMSLSWFLLDLIYLFLNIFEKIPWEGDNSVWHLAVFLNVFWSLPRFDSFIKSIITY